jgi:two-component system LytT family response regulator
LSSRNIGTFEEELNPKNFFRTHSKYIINIDKIKRITKQTNLSCELQNKKSIPVAKLRQESLFTLLKLK